MAFHPFKKPNVCKGFNNLNTDGHGLTRIKQEQAVSKADNSVKILRPQIGVRLIIVVIYLAGIALLSFHLPFNIPERYKPLVLTCFVIGGAFAVVDIFLKRIALQNDRITIVSLSDYVSRTIPRADIESVTWEKGCGASMKLCDGKWVRLPNVGLNAQGLTNTIRAWLKRTEGVT